MKDINPEDHFGKPLPEELQPSHEIQARKFMDVAQDYMSRMHPDVTFFTYYLTGIEVFQGEGAEKSLRNWDKPEMDEYRDPDLKEVLEEQVKQGRKADIESAELSRVRCTMLGDIESELTEALKQITLLAAEKGGSLENTEIEKNILAGLKKKDPTRDWGNLDKEFSQHTHFIFS